MNYSEIIKSCLRNQQKTTDKVIVYAQSQLKVYGHVYYHLIDVKDMLLLDPKVKYMIMFIKIDLVVMVICYFIIHVIFKTKCMLNSGSKFDIMNPIVKEIVEPGDDDPWGLSGMITDEEPEEFFASF